MSQSQSSQGDRSPNISNVEGDANIDASQDSRATQIEKNAIKGTGYAEEIKGSSYTGKNTYVDSTHIEVLPPPSPFKSDFPSNLPLIYSSNFVGREQALETLHEQLESQAGVEISAPSKVASVEGMGGIGKTELALQYALRYGEESYKGGVLWLSVRDRNVGIQIVDFARNQLGLTLPEETELEKLVQFCWGHWPGGDRVLVVWDDVGEFQQIKPFLPPNRSRFKMVITTRKKGLSHSFGSLVLEVLEEDAALALLAALAGEERIAAELEMAKELCAWLGYLPLGLELVGQYLAERQDLSLAEMKGRLEKKGLEQKALREYTAEATAQRGVKAAFELSWQELSAEAKEVACLLSLFAVAPISWEWVQGCLEWDEEDLEDVRDGVLVKFSLLQRLDAGWYQLHSLLQMFMRGKLEEFAEAEKLKRQYCRVMVIASQQMPETPTLEQVEEFSVLVPHLEEVTARWCNFVEDEDLIDPFTQIARYYEGQGLYSQAELWYKQCLSGVRDRLGEEHPYIASSLNNLAGLYHSQGRYEEAEICSLQDLEISRKLLGEENPHVASSLNTLAALYYSQGKYLEAEPLYLQALELRKKLLGKENFYVASSLNNLAELYRSQGRYQEAELLYL
ncbi:MAG: tetratricopeptide repeat protein, partial [Cyanobacteria bacterium P01_E01_bin.42]